MQYTESSLPDARLRLLELAAHLRPQPGFRSAELLSSPDQPGLYLLTARWSAAPTALSLPPGMRGWIFMAEPLPGETGTGPAGDSPA